MTFTVHNIDIYVKCHEHVDPKIPRRPFNLDIPCFQFTHSGCFISFYTKKAGKIMSPKPPPRKIKPLSKRDASK